MKRSVIIEVRYVVVESFDAVVDVPDNWTPEAMHDAAMAAYRSDNVSGGHESIDESIDLGDFSYTVIDGGPA